jgi:hypothetical protein
MFTYITISSTGIKASPRTNLIKGTRATFSKHLLCDLTCRSLAQLDLHLKPINRKHYIQARYNAQVSMCRSLTRHAIDTLTAKVDSMVYIS